VLEAGQSPRAGGLHRDEHGLVVGTHGLVVVQGRARLAALLVALSQLFDLSAGVQVEGPLAGDFPDLTDPYLLTLTPPDPTVAGSAFCEAVRGAIAAAHLSPRRAHLCVGNGRVFVPFADPAAPHGCDVDGEAPASGRVVLRPQGAWVLPPPQPVPLLEVLRDGPLEPTTPAPPTTLTVLTDRRLAALVAGYGQRHGLSASVRFLTWQQGEQTREAALFELADAREGRPIAPFVLAFLGRLLHTTLLTDALPPTDTAPDRDCDPSCRVLVAWGQRTPLHLPHLERLLPAGSALVLAGPPWGRALVHPLPPRQQVQHLTCVDLPAPARVAVSERPAGTLRLALTFGRNGGTPGPVHGLLLDERALHRLRRLVRRLPAPWFAHARIAGDEGVALVIAPDAPRGIEGLPVGLPLTRTEVAGLLLPRGVSLRPALPPDLLAPVLALQEDTLTVLTPTCRYDAPLAAFQPVRTLLALDMPQPPIPIRVQPTPLPALDLSDLWEEAPPAPRAAAPPPPPPEPREPPKEPPKEGLRSIARGLLGRKPSASSSDDLRQHAEQMEQRGHHATAAVFYAYLGDPRKAKACYQRAVEQAQAQPQEP
jgi:hypothetical protein